MSAAIKFDESRGAAMSGDGEGVMHDVLKRLGALEVQVGVVVATLPHLGTRAAIDSILATIPHLATKADVGELRSEMRGMETRIIKWIIATVLTTAGVVFSIAKFVH